MTDRPRWRRRLVLGGLLLLLLLGGLEAGLRLQGFAQRASIWFDPDVGFRNQARQTRWMIGPKGEQLAQISTNALGFRGPLVEQEKTPGRTRVLTLGDSFTFGLGAPEGETYPARLERSLLQGEGQPAEVLDMSFPGWAPANELGAYLHLGRDYAPDIVVLGFTTDDLKPADQGVRYTDNVLFRWFGRTAILEAVQRNVLSKLESYRIEREPEEAKLRADYEKRPLAIQQNPSQPFAQVYWERVHADLQALRDACRSDGAKLLVAAFPSGPQVRKVRGAAAGSERDQLRAEQSAFQNELLRRCAELEIEAIFVLPAFEAVKGNPMGVQDPSHPGPLGYQAMAGSVAAKLRRLGWI